MPLTVLAVFVAYSATAIAFYLDQLSLIEYFLSVFFLVFRQTSVSDVRFVLVILLPWIYMYLMLKKCEFDFMKEVIFDKNSRSHEEKIVEDGIDRLPNQTC